MSKDFRGAAKLYVKCCQVTGSRRPCVTVCLHSVSETRLRTGTGVVVYVGPLAWTTFISQSAATTESRLTCSTCRQHKNGQIKTHTHGIQRWKIQNHSWCPSAAIVRWPVTVRPQVYFSLHVRTSSSTCERKSLGQDGCDGGMSALNRYC